MPLLMEPLVSTPGPGKAGELAAQLSDRFTGPLRQPSERAAQTLVETQDEYERRKWIEAANREPILAPAAPMPPDAQPAGSTGSAPDQRFRMVPQASPHWPETAEPGFGFRVIHADGRAQATFANKADAEAFAAGPQAEASRIDYATLESGERLRGSPKADAPGPGAKGSPAAPGSDLTLKNPQTPGILTIREFVKLYYPEHFAKKTAPTYLVNGITQRYDEYVQRERAFRLAGAEQQRRQVETASEADLRKAQAAGKGAGPAKREPRTLEEAITSAILSGDPQEKVDVLTKTWTGMHGRPKNDAEQALRNAAIKELAATPGMTAMQAIGYLKDPALAVPSRVSTADTPIDKQGPSQWATTLKTATDALSKPTTVKGNVKAKLEALRFAKMKLPTLVLAQREELQSQISNAFATPVGDIARALRRGELTAVEALELMTIEQTPQAEIDEAKRSGLFRPNDLQDMGFGP